MAISGRTALSPAEQGVLDELARGRSNRAIARDLFLSERTVEKHIAAVFLKLGLENAPDTNRRVLAALLALA